MDNPYRWYGLDAPSGRRWYSFAPLGYIECATVGAFGGWEEGDDTGRNYVPGKCAAVRDGELVAVEPQDVEDPRFTMSALTWEELTVWLWAGQEYG